MPRHAQPARNASSHLALASGSGWLSGHDLHGEPGVLACDPIADRIQCHLCGAWYHKFTWPLCWIQMHLADNRGAGRQVPAQRGSIPTGLRPLHALAARGSPDGDPDAA